MGYTFVHLNLQTHGHTQGKQFIYGLLDYFPVICSETLRAGGRHFWVWKGKEELFTTCISPTCHLCLFLRNQDELSTCWSLCDSVLISSQNFSIHFNLQHMLFWPTSTERLWYCHLVTSHSTGLGLPVWILMWTGGAVYCSNSPLVLCDVMLWFRGIFILPLLCSDF